MRIVSIDSLGVRSGAIIGIRLDNIIVPEPGGPSISRLQPPTLNCEMESAQYPAVA